MAEHLPEPVDPSDVKHDQTKPYGSPECPGCAADPNVPTRDHTPEEAADVRQPDGEGPGPEQTWRAVHEVTVDSVNHLRLTNGGGTWVFTPDMDAQAGDLVLLHARDGLYASPEIFAVGVIAHVAHPWTYHSIKRGQVLLTLRDLRPARATAEATE